jgi:hypothetical protein
MLTLFSAAFAGMVDVGALNSSLCLRQDGDDSMLLGC